MIGAQKFEYFEEDVVMQVPKTCLQTRNATDELWNCWTWCGKLTV